MKAILSEGAPPPSASRTAATALLAFVGVGCVALGAACSEPIDAGGEPGQETFYDDPLAIEDTAEPGSFDDLYRRVIVTSCSGQAGLCHNGQFEPNLSTPALAWVNLVQRPSLEKTALLRVDPGAPEGSVLIDKLRDRDVISRMPLGANPLAEEDIALFEKWISSGAKRSPGAEALEALDNPPEEPILGVFDPAGERLDTSGTAVASPGEEVVLRMTTHDFETPDDEVPYAFFLLQTVYGDVVILQPETSEAYVGYATHDPEGPELGEERFNWEYRWVVPEQVTMVLVDGSVATVPTVGMSFLLVGGYGDNSPGDGAMALAFTIDALRIEAP